MDTKTSRSEFLLKKDIFFFFTEPGFNSGRHHALAKEFLPLLLHDLLRSETLVSVLNRLLNRRWAFLLLSFFKLSCRRCKTFHVHTERLNSMMLMSLQQPNSAIFTFLFGIFILFASLVLSLVATLRLNHWLYSFLWFLRLLKGPHMGRATSFAAVLRLSLGFKTSKEIKNLTHIRIHFTQNMQYGNKCSPLLPKKLNEVILKLKAVV